MKLYVATLTCKPFATFMRPTRPVAILAASYDEALGKAVQQARGIWRGHSYSEHTADIAEIPAELIAAFLEAHAIRARSEGGAG